MKKKRVLKKWVKNTIRITLGVIACISIYQSMFVRTIKKTPVGEYVCRGKIIQVCSGSEEVAAYLGV